MQHFDFQTPSQIVFGSGSLARLPQLIENSHLIGSGKNCLMVTGRDTARALRVTELLREAGIPAPVFSVAGEPTLDAVRDGVRVSRKEKAGFVIGFGGGSAIDAAKAIGALAANSGEPLDYLEVIGRGGKLERPGLPCIAIPTTAGTGAEVTRNAVLGAPDHGLKASLRGAYVLPVIALVDPELTRGLPAGITANTGFDALTQLLEASISRRANAMTAMFCREGLARIRGSLAAAYRSAGKGGKAELPAREDMAFASLLSGLVLSNAGLGAVHGFAAPLGGMLQAAHGAICASLLCSVVKVNGRALAERQPDGEALQSLRQAAGILTGNPEREHLDAWLMQLRSELQIRPLANLGLQRKEFPTVVERAKAANSMRGNPVNLTDGDLNEIVEDAWDFR